MDEEKEVIEENVRGEVRKREDKNQVTFKQQCENRCNRRLHELAIPHRRMFLALWNEHAHHLPSTKVNNLKRLLQELYAMTPEETSKYFAELRAEAKAAKQRRRLKLRLRKYVTEKHNQKERERAYRLFKEILKGGFRFAMSAPLSPLISLRLRYLSDIILERICDLKNVIVPSRSEKDNMGNLLIPAADWIAVGIERLHYLAQIAINDEILDQTNDFDQDNRVGAEPNEDEATTEDKGQTSIPRDSIQVPSDFSFSDMMKDLGVLTSTPRNSFQQASDRRSGPNNVMKRKSNKSAIGPPMKSSTPRGSIQLPTDFGSMGVPTMESTPRSSIQQDKNQRGGPKKPDKSTTVAQALNQKRTPKTPYHSFIESEPATPSPTAKSKKESHSRNPLLDKSIERRSKKSESSRKILDHEKSTLDIDTDNTTRRIDSISKPKKDSKTNRQDTSNKNLRNKKLFPTDSGLP